MADKKISELTALTTPDGTEELIVNDSGVSKKITQSNLLKGIDNTAADATAITINASEVVMIGKSTYSSAEVGTMIDTRLFQTSDGTPTTYLNRLTTDGDIAVFRKDGTTVGSIGTNNGHPYFAGTTAGIRVVGAIVRPSDHVGNNNDNAVDLGYASARYDNIYATNGTIQTSDRNEKQDIEELSVAETAVATACKGLLRKFRWQDAVAEKGDDARIHFGIIAQDLQDAFAAEGLDAGRYAMFISTTWYEKLVPVDAVIGVEAAEATYDDEGAELTPAVEAVEAKDAYTRTDTEDEPTVGYTERTRLGVRYPELLAFIISAM